MGTDSIPNPKYTISLSALIAAHGGGFEDQEDRVDEDADDGREDDGGDSVREEERNLEGEDTIGQREIAANAAD